MEHWQGRKVVVPGGAGVIGSHLVERLAAAGAEVTVLDSFVSGSRENLAAVADRIAIVEADAASLEVCESVFRGADCVMNLAGRAPGIQLTPDHHDRLLGANLALAQSVLEAARTQRIPRTLIVSSSCVYPDDAPVPTPELPVCTGEPERINRGYGWAKRHTELLAAHYAEKFGMSITIARPFNAFGPRDTYTGPGAHVIPALIDRVLTAENEVIVWGSGRQTRSFIHARDVARALALLTARHITPDPLNVGHDSETTIADLVAAIQTVAGTKKPVVFDTTKPEGALRKSADMTKLRRVLGAFEPEVDLLTGLAEMVAAMRR